MDLAEQVLAGERLALARLLTLIENEEPQGLETLATLYPYTGHAHLVGVTGAPGTGKSTLVNQLTLRLRQGIGDYGTEEPKVGIVAVDPSSPFTGGAILGDRIRMRDLTGDSGIFIRSMASRGALGGLARATAGVVQALDAAGFKIVLIETVGAGQAEVDIARTAHTVVVITAPGMGDEVQAIKAGILEIADILVVNKSDITSAENTLRALKATLEMATPLRYSPEFSQADDDAIQSEAEGWEIPILPTIATQGDGIHQLAQAIGAHRNYLAGSGELGFRERERLQSEMHGLLRDYLAQRFLDSQPDGRFEEALARVLSRQISPRQAVMELLSGEKI